MRCVWFLVAIVAFPLAAAPCQAEQALASSPFPLPVTLAADKYAWLVDSALGVRVMVRPGETMSVDYDAAGGLILLRYEGQEITYQPRPRAKAAPPSDQLLVSVYGTRPRVVELEASGLSKADAARRYYEERRAVQEESNSMYRDAYTEALDNSKTVDEAIREAAAALAESMASSPLVASVRASEGGVFVRWAGEHDEVEIYCLPVPDSGWDPEAPFLPRTPEQAIRFHHLVSQQLEVEGTPSVFSLVDGSIAFTPLRSLEDVERVTRFAPPKEELR